MTEEQIRDLGDHLRLYFGYPKYSPQDAACQQYAAEVARWMASRRLGLAELPSEQPIPS